jgi:hypothetical protein
VIVNNEYFRPYQLILDVGFCPRTLYPDVGILVRMAKRERSASNTHHASDGQEKES